MWYIPIHDRYQIQSANNSLQTLIERAVTYCAHIFKRETKQTSSIKQAPSSTR